MKTTVSANYSRTQLGFCPMSADEFVQKCGYNFVPQQFNPKDSVLTAMNELMGGRHYHFRSPSHGIYSSLLFGTMVGMPPRNIVLGAISLQQGTVVDFFTKIRDKTGVRFFEPDNWPRDLLFTYKKGVETMLRKTLELQ